VRKCCNSECVDGSEEVLNLVAEGPYMVRPLHKYYVCSLCTCVTACTN
jgi:hypothetical protein